MTLRTTTERTLEREAIDERTQQRARETERVVAADLLQAKAAAGMAIAVRAIGMGIFTEREATQLTAAYERLATVIKGIYPRPGR